jgi:hypothetical protein
MEKVLLDSDAKTLFCCHSSRHRFFPAQFFRSPSTNGCVFFAVLELYTPSPKAEEALEALLAPSQVKAAALYDVAIPREV